MAERRETDRRQPAERNTQAVRKAIRQELARDASGAPSAVDTQKPPVVSLEHVSLAFDVPIVKDISFEAHEGETVVIVGESGTGKSTILKLILRLLVPDDGRVL